MRRPRLTNLFLAFTATASVAVITPNVEAGGGWGWKKPINQRLGAFYTSNRAFKKNTSSSRYRSSSQRYSTPTRTYSVSPTYHGHVSSHQGTIVVPSTSSTIIRSIPSTTTRVATTPPPVSRTIRSSTPTVQPPVAPAVTAAPTVTTRVVEKKQTRVHSETAPNGGNNEAQKNALDLLRPKKLPNASSEINQPSRGAVRIQSEPADNEFPANSDPLPFNSTTNTFWE